MTRTRWALIALVCTPVLIGATLVTGAFGPLGGIAYGALLLAGVNAPRLFHDHHLEDQQ